MVLAHLNPLDVLWMFPFSQYTTIDYIKQAHSKLWATALVYQDVNKWPLEKVCCYNMGICIYISHRDL